MHEEDEESRPCVRIVQKIEEELEREQSHKQRVSDTHEAPHSRLEELVTHNKDAEGKCKVDSSQHAHAAVARHRK